MARKQCAKCPWKVSTNPYDIPNGYCPTKHAALSSTITEPSSLRGILGGTLRMMACHETLNRAESPCVGWLAHQLGPGNNLALRMAVMSKQVDADFELDGDQHPNLQATLP